MTDPEARIVDAGIAAYVPDGPIDLDVVALAAAREALTHVKDAVHTIGTLEDNAQYLQGWHDAEMAAIAEIEQMLAHLTEQEPTDDPRDVAPSPRVPPGPASVEPATQTVAHSEVETLLKEGAEQIDLTIAWLEEHHHIAPEWLRVNALFEILVSTRSALRASETARQDALAAAMHYSATVDEGRKQLYALKERVEAAETAKRELEAEFRTVHEKLDAGTLHVAYCNGNHDKRVGTEGMICNCTLGREIKTLRHDLKQAETAKQQAEQERDELPPSLRTSLYLWRHSPTEWHAEWRRGHEFRVGLIERAEQLTASLAQREAEIARLTTELESRSDQPQPGSRDADPRDDYRGNS